VKWQNIGVHRPGKGRGIFIGNEDGQYKDNEDKILLLMILVTKV
jgi:hypothetical protein